MLRDCHIPSAGKSVRKLELVEKMREILLNPEEVPTGGPRNVLSNYREFLEMSYQQLPQPGMLFNQWPVMSSYCALPLSAQPSKSGTLGSLHTSYSPFLPLIEEIALQHGNDGVRNLNRGFTFHSFSVVLVVAWLSKVCQDQAKLLLYGILANNGLRGSCSDSFLSSYQFYFLAPECNMPHA